MGKTILAFTFTFYFISLALNALGIKAWLPKCVFTTYTGFHCIGCGMNRAAILLLQGNFGEAMRANPLIVIAALAAVYVLVSALIRRKRLFVNG